MYAEIVPTAERKAEVWTRPVEKVELVAVRHLRGVSFAPLWYR